MSDPITRSAAHLAHEVSLPLTAILIYAEATARWLATDPPNVDRAKRAIARIIEDGRRAADIVKLACASGRPTPAPAGALDINDVIDDVLEHLRGELRRDGATAERPLSKRSRQSSPVVPPPGASFKNASRRPARRRQRDKAPADVSHQQPLQPQR